MSTLENTLKQLRLSGLLQTLDVRLQEAVANRLGHAEFLELICQDEINVRQQRLMERRTKAADFRGLKTLEDFDWSFNPAIHRKDIYDLATGNFIRQAKEIKSKSNDPSCAGGFAEARPSTAAVPKELFRAILERIGRLRLATVLSG